ncbi:MAG: hypothetical protein A4E38_01640 [Methanoregulaceae archaeon PtaB.Bin108]|nr:MAG: hypothetical protein A4E38_01640 [Methanoregulaceae archaeon PtaB.Bin108]
MVIATLPSVTPFTTNVIAESSGPDLLPCNVMLVVIEVALFAAVPPRDMRSKVPDGMVPESVVEYTPPCESPTFFTSVSPFLMISMLSFVFQSVAERNPSLREKGRKRFSSSNENVPPGVAAKVPWICIEKRLVSGRSMIEIVTWSPSSIWSGATDIASADTFCARSSRPQRRQHRRTVTRKASPYI